MRPRSKVCLFHVKQNVRLEYCFGRFVFLSLRCLPFPPLSSTSFPYTQCSLGLCNLYCQKGFQEYYCLWIKSLLFLPYVTQTIKNLLWFASLWSLWNWHVTFRVARQRTHFLGLDLASFLCTQSVYSRPLYFILTGGRLYTGYLERNILCKLDGDSVVAIIESSKNGCTVRKLACEPQTHFRSSLL